MAISCYVGDHISIDVDDPGYGYLGVHFYSDDPAENRRRAITLRGRAMWRALESLTQLVCTVDGETYGDVEGLWPMSVLEATRMLPQFQTAVLYAAAGSDVAERLTDDADARYVLCARCHEGSDYSGHVMSNEDCQQYGHQPFGYVGKWDQAQDYAAREREWAEIQQRNAEPVIIPTDTLG